MSKDISSLIYKPLKFIVGYIIVTIILTFIGPVEYNDYSYWKMLFFMFFVILAIILGYFSSTNIYNKNQKRILSKNEKYFIKGSSVKLIIVISIFGALTFEVLTFFSYISSLSDLSLHTLFYRVQNVGDIYKSSLAVAREATEINRIRQFITFFGLLKQIAIVGYLFEKDKLKKYKFLFWGTILLNLINVLAFKGTQKEIGDLIIYFFSVWLIKKGISGKVKLQKAIIPMTTICIVVFGFMQLSRANTYSIDKVNLQNAFFKFNSNHIVYKIFGETMGYAITSVIHYVSGGYYGLTKSLEVPFKWTYGLGNSFALSSYATQYLGVDYMINYSIPSRAEAITGYPALMYWSTIFPWLASDFTFPGCIVLMFIISRLYAISWREAIYNKNLLSVLLFTRLNIMWLFLPANNQLMQTRESAIATIALFVIWILYHNKFSTNHS